MAEAEESQWSHLPADLLNTIATRLNTNADVDTCSLSIPIIHSLRLRSVCKKWRSSVSPTPNPPNTIVPFPIAPNPALNPSRRGHFNLSLTTTYLLQQPPLQQSSSSSSSSTNCKYWLLRVENGDTNKWRPLNIHSRILTSNSGIPNEFPRTIDLLNFRVYQIATSYAPHFVDRSKMHIQIQSNESKSFHPKKIVVSTSGPRVALAISESKLYSLKIGDEEWKRVGKLSCDDVIFHKRKFYAIDIEGRTVSVVGSNLRASKIVPRLHPYGVYFKKFVECNGELFLTVKYVGGDGEISDDEEFGAYMEDPDPEDETVNLKIYRLNEEKREWERVEDLGDHVFFTWDDYSYSICTRDFPGLKRNSVYFCDASFFDMNEEHGTFIGGMGVYCLGDRKCGAVANFPYHLSLFWPPPTWLMPIATKSKK